MEGSGQIDFCRKCLDWWRATSEQIFTRLARSKIRFQNDLKHSVKFGGDQDRHSTLALGADFGNQLIVTSKRGIALKQFIERAGHRYTSLGSLGFGLGTTFSTRET